MNTQSIIQMILESGITISYDSTGHHVSATLRKRYSGPMPEYQEMQTTLFSEHVRYGQGYTSHGKPKPFDVYGNADAAIQSLQKRIAERFLTEGIRAEVHRAMAHGTPYEPFFAAVTSQDAPQRAEGGDDD